MLQRKHFLSENAHCLCWEDFKNVALSHIQIFLKKLKISLDKFLKTGADHGRS